MGSARENRLLCRSETELRLGEILTGEQMKVQEEDRLPGPGTIVDDQPEGILDADPLFADPGYWHDGGTPDNPADDVWVPGDYHLQSRQGRFEAASGQWLADVLSSPAIDAGDPNSLWRPEPAPNGGRINLGAYGGTGQAGKSAPQGL